MYLSMTKISEKTLGIQMPYYGESGGVLYTRLLKALLSPKRQKLLRTELPIERCHKSSSLRRERDAPCSAVQLSVAVLKTPVWRMARDVNAIGRGGGVCQTAGLLPRSPKQLPVRRVKTAATSTAPLCLPLRDF